MRLASPPNHTFSMIARKAGALIPLLPPAPSQDSPKPRAFQKDRQPRLTKLGYFDPNRDQATKPVFLDHLQVDDGIPQARCRVVLLLTTLHDLRGKDDHFHPRYTSPWQRNHCAMA